MNAAYPPGSGMPTNQAEARALTSKRIIISIVLGTQVSMGYEFFSTHLPVEAGMNTAFFRIVIILRELVETERKYVEDLELVQVGSTTYPRRSHSCSCRTSGSLFTPISRIKGTLVNRGAFGQDIVHRLFPGLNELLDVQHKFLLDCEEQYQLPWEEQRWGKCFTVNVRHF